MPAHRFTRRQRGGFHVTLADTVSGPGAAGFHELHPDTGVPWVSVAVVVLGAFMAILDTSIVNVALPKLMAVFAVDATRIEWIATGYILSSGVVVPLTGYLGDRFGRKKMFVFAIVVFTAGSALCGLAWSNDTMVGFRVVQAVGGGMIMPLSMSIIYSLVPREKIGMALGLWGIAIAFGPSVGPTLGGWLVDRFDWRLIFYINLPIGIVTVILVMLLLPALPKRPHLKLDLVGSILVAWGAFAFLLALSQGQDKGWTSLYIVTLFVSGGFAFILFALWELGHPEPILDIRLLKNGVFTLSLAATALASFGLFSAIFLMPILLQNLLGYTPLQTGLVLLPAALTTGVFQPISGRLFDKVGAFWPSFAGLAMVVWTTYRMHTLGLASSWHDIQLLLVLRSVGLGLGMMPTSTAGLYTIPQPLVGRATALNNLVRQIASSMGIALVTYVMTSRADFHYNWLAGTFTYGSPAAAAAWHRLSPPLGRQAAVGALYGVVQRQSFALGIDDAFVVGAALVALALPLVCFMTKGRVDAARSRALAAFASRTSA